MSSKVAPLNMSWPDFYFRLALATVGNYLFCVLFTVVFSLTLSSNVAFAITEASTLSMIVFPTIMIWAISARSALFAWAVVGGFTLLLSLLYLIIKLGN
ncbi:hypothetical protein SJ2017_3684 [Shewanella japonica]|uniref:DUF3649 domain-containing protein n=1 Tax=Shewanella japonica TaxID=93973 RepID=A0ABN4YJY0_9GAMM|nr:hypothetical protein SJ2017_3684 [Shewanella japonica]